MKLNKQLAYMLKIAKKDAAKRTAEIKKIQNKAASKTPKRKHGCNSELPTDIDWEAVYYERFTNRFYTDKCVKGANRAIQTAMCDL